MERQKTSHHHGNHFNLCCEGQQVDIYLVGELACISLADDVTVRQVEQVQHLCRTTSLFLFFLAANVGLNVLLCNLRSTECRPLCYHCLHIYILLLYELLGSEYSKTQIRELHTGQKINKK